MTAERLFALRRTGDPTGMSGVGIVAYGVAYPHGRAVVQWLGDRPSTVAWRRVDDAEYIHSHGGTAPTVIEWLEEGTAEWETARRSVDGGVQFLGDVSCTGPHPPHAALDRVVRELARAVRDGRPIDFGGTSIPVWVQVALVEELTGGKAAN